MSSTTQPPLPFRDLALARRLERTEGLSSARFVETRAVLFPESGAEWIEIAGAYAMYDGVASPCTQTFGLGLFETPTGADLDAIEAFYAARGAPVFHEVSPLADVSLLALLNERGYQPIELSSVMFRAIARGSLPEMRLNPCIEARLIRSDERELWARTAAKGWSEAVDLADQILELMHISVNAPRADAFLAELDGRAIAAGLLIIRDGVALLGGAATVPEERKQGAQLALLDARLRHAADKGCDLAMICTQPPGGASQHNAERHGFHSAYTRIKWGAAARPTPLAQGP